ncbi:alpha/beta fold hydrolase [Mycolicibacterium neoaurum]|uniref:alpha/beta fold hydrolase n=1 Tax=Mycolicibacterium neoaurum TaxID=1795 RepID=UPI0005F0B3AC|nr:carboxylesterase [Mycolicibacterium neoaurum]AXK76680.1 alpha/beta hydrolase [Mycolicibacterium neoaurum]KUM07730.1 carboxylesterase [Mycolicibacterium neoaurum]
MTSTSRATWPSRSPSSSAVGVGHWRSDAARAHFAAVYATALARLPAVDRIWDVDTAFGTVRVYRFAGGPGRPVVLLPGRNASTPMWADNLSGLLAHRPVYCIDLLGEPGMSVQRKPITGADDQARWLDDVLTGIGEESVHVLGVSFGGWSAMNYALRRPQKVASLVLIDPVLTFAPIPLRTMLAFLPMGLPGVPDRVRRRILRWISGGADVDESDPALMLIDAGTADFALQQPTPARFSPEKLRALRVPVLAIIAGRSVIHDASRAAATARSVLSAGQVEVWPRASHAVTGEFPDEIAARTSEFWAGVDR